MSEQTQALAVAAQSSSLMKVDEVVNQLNTVTDLMRKAMNEGNDFGTIPGCGSKPTLLKPGAEKLNVLFRLSPTYKTDILPLEGPHREYRVTCTLTHGPTGIVRAQGEGSCSTMESKYRWRNADRLCPSCGKPTIIKGKAEFGGGWICFAKKGGCGVKFADNDPKITGQSTGRAENPDIADQYNTCLKMACKRALVAATLNATGASALFTQDLEDLPMAEEAPATGEKPPAVVKAEAVVQKAASQIFDDLVTSVQPCQYTNTKTKKQGTYWRVFTEGGTELVTFSESIKTQCEEALASNLRIGFEWEDNGRGAIIRQICQPQAVTAEVVS